MYNNNYRSRNSISNSTSIGTSAEIKKAYDILRDLNLPYRKF